MSRLQRYVKNFAQYDTKIIAIASQKKSVLKKLKLRLKLSFSLVSDPSLKIIRNFGVEHKGRGISRPAVFIVGPTGTIEWKKIAPKVSERPSEKKLLNIVKAIFDKYQSKKNKNSATRPAPTSR